jgi:hypothetical protein
MTNDAEHDIRHETKMVYVKRWRTLVRLPAKYADEIVAALRIPDDAQGDVEISQHIGWLKQYLAGMTEHNWRDMRMLAGRQLDALAAAQPLSAVAQSAQVTDAIKVIRTEPCPFEDSTDMAYGWFEAAATFLNRLGVDTDSPTTAQPPAAPVEIDVLSRLVDWTYLHATEGEVWPSSKTKADLITRARQDAPRQKHADAMKALPRSSAGNADETAPGQSLLECRDFIAALIGGAPFEGRAIEHARELIQNADTALATFNEPQQVKVTDADVERAWAAMVGADVAGMCFQASVVRGDIRTALESLSLPRPQRASESAPDVSTPVRRPHE